MSMRRREGRLRGWGIPDLTDDSITLRLFGILIGGFCYKQAVVEFELIFFSYKLLQKKRHRVYVFTYSYCKLYRFHANFTTNTRLKLKLTKSLICLTFYFIRLQ